MCGICVPVLCTCAVYVHVWCLCFVFVCCVYVYTVRGVCVVYRVCASVHVCVWYVTGSQGKDERLGLIRVTVRLSELTSFNQMSDFGKVQVSGIF